MVSFGDTYNRGGCLDGVRSISSHAARKIVYFGTTVAESQGVNEGEPHLQTIVFCS